MLFRVLDEITDVTRVSGMVQKRRLIYRMTSFDYRKVFRVTGNVPGMTNGFRVFTGGGGATHPGEAHRPWGWRTSPWWAGGTAQEGPMRQRIRNQRERKKKGRWERKEGLHLPIQVGFGLEGEDFPPWLGRPPWGSLSPKARSPPSHLYIRRYWG